MDLEWGGVVLDENKTDDPSAWALSPDVVRANTIYAVSQGELFVTDETFATFTSKGMLPRGIADVFVGPHGELITYASSMGSDLAFHISRDEGATWQPRNAALPGRWMRW
ncbi:hypothetical protein ACMHYB_21065 [Sorangium sp. So ce1128]